jgi:arsenical pump membrane protein
MHLTNLHQVLIWLIALSSILCMLLRPRGLPEAFWACGGAALLIVTGLIPLRQAGWAAYDGWDVYLFLAGMMILAELAREQHVFDWVADLAAQHARGSSLRLFLLVYLVGIAVTALLSNDATAVVLTPAVLAVVRRARVQPKPYLLTCALIANAASFVFPISNPANLVVFDRHVPPLASWLKVFLLPSVASIVVTYLCLRWWSRDALKDRIHHRQGAIELTGGGRFALGGLLFAATLLIISSALALPLGAPTCVSAFFVMALVSLKDRAVLQRAIKGVSWSVLPLVGGLFVIVEALQSAGLLRMGLVGLRLIGSLPAFAAKSVAAFSVALTSNAMNNLPVGLMSGATIRHANEAGIISHAILLGVDLGPNLSVTGSLATILWLIALRRERVEFTAWEFFKVGIVAMPLSLLAGLLFLWS